MQFSFEVFMRVEVTAPKNKRLSCCADMKQGILRLGGVRTAVCVHVTAPGGTLGVGGQGICSQPHCQLAKATSLILVLDGCELTSCGYVKGKVC